MNNRNNTKNIYTNIVVFLWVQKFILIKISNFIVPIINFILYENGLVEIKFNVLIDNLYNII